MPSPRALVATPYRRGVLTLAVLTLCWRAWTISHWSWQDDDWVYLADAASMPLWSYAFQMYNGHLMPAQFLLTWVITSLAPLNFAAAVAVVALLAAASVWVWGRAFSALAGERAVMLIPLALVALSPLFIRPTMWWASAIQAVPLQLCLAAGVLVAARMATAPSLRETAKLALVLLVAVLFWEKSILLAIPFTVTLLCAQGGRPVERLRLHWRTIVAMAAVCATYTAGYLFLTFNAANQTGSDINFNRVPTWSETADFFWTGISNILAPALLGGPWGSLPTPDDFFAAPEPWVASASVAVVAAVLVITLVARRGAWLPLGVAMLYVLGAWTMVLASSRFVNIGTVAVKDERYVIDGFAVFVVCAVIAWTGEHRRTRRSRGTRRSQPSAPRGRWMVLVGGALAVSLVVSNVMAADRNGTAPGAAWLDTLRAEVSDAAQERPADAPVVLLDSLAPDHVVQGAFWGENAKLSLMLGPLAPDVTFYQPSDVVWAVDDAGRLQPAQLTEAITSEPGPDENCGYRLDAGAAVDVPMSGELHAWGWGVQLSSFSDKPASLTVELPGGDVDLELPPGPQVRTVQYDGEVPASLVVRSRSLDGILCITRLGAGTLAAGS